MKKYIYMPTNSDAGMKKYHPEVIFVDSEFGSGKLREFRGNTDEKELESGRFRFYFASRCVEFDDHFWALCKVFIDKLDKEEANHKKFEACILREVAKQNGTK